MAAPLSYFRGDEIPYWVATITINGAAIDFSTGWSFTVTVYTSAATALTKTFGIYGASDGSVTVIWGVGDLDITESRYRIQLTGKRASDDRQFTIQDTIEIKPREVAGP